MEKKQSEQDNERCEIMLSYSNDKINSHIKIFHIADQQIEVVANQHDRFDEYDYTNKKTAAAAKRENPDLIVITGDIFENGNRGTINENEKALFISLLNLLLESTTCSIIITNGNHEMQKGEHIPRLYRDGKMCVPIDEIDNVVKTMDNKRLFYHKFTGKYTHTIKGVDYNFIVHSHYNKQLSFLPPYFYTEETNPEEANVALYHDATINHSIGFDKTKKDGIGTVDIDVFSNVNTVISGDIHMPQIHQIGITPHGNPKILAYCSSLTMRNFGEGDYYSNAYKYQEGTSKHGYMIWELNKLGETVRCNFNPIKPCVTFATIKLTKLFNEIALQTPAHVKIISSVAPDDTLLMKKRIVDNPNCLSVILEGNYSVAPSEESETFKERTEFSKDQLLEESLGYVENVVEGSRGFEDKEQTKDLLKGMVSSAFESVMLTKPIKHLEFESLELENFLGVRHAHIPLNRDITKIGGTNAAGKTTCAKALKWCVNGMITGNEKKNRKTHNLLLLKSTLNEDPLKVTTKLTLNGDSYVICRMVNFLKGKPKVAISLTINGVPQESTDFDKLLNDLFPFEEIKEIYQNITSLDNFIHQSPENLRTEILRRVGIGAIETLDQNFNMIKSEYMSKLPNPEGTKAIYEGIISKCVGDVESYQLEVEKRLSHIEELNSSIVKDDLNKGEIVELINHKQGLLEPDTTKEYFRRGGELESLREELSNIDTRIKFYTQTDKFDYEKLENLKTELGDIDSRIKSTREILNTQKAELEKITKEETKWKELGIAKKRDLESVVSDRYYNKKSDIKDKIATIKRENDSLIADERKSKDFLQSLNNAYENLNSKLKSIDSEISTEKYSIALCLKDEYLNKLSTSIEKLKFKQRKSVEEYNSISEKLKDIERSYDAKNDLLRLYENNLCKNCGLPHGAEVSEIELIKADIEQLESELKEMLLLKGEFVVVDNSDEVASLSKEARKVLILVDSMDYEKISKKLGEIESDRLTSFIDAKVLCTENIKSKKVEIDSYKMVDNSEIIDSKHKEIASLNKRIDGMSLNDGLDKECSTNTEFLDIVSSYKSIANSLKIAKTNLAERESEINDLDIEYKQKLKEVSQQERLANEWVSKGDQMALLSNRKIDINEKIAKKEKDYSSIKNIFEANKIIESELSELNKEVECLVKNIAKNSNSIREMIHQNELSEMKVLDKEKEIGRCKSYLKQIERRSFGKKTMNLFKKIVSGNGLPLYVFNQIANILNTRLAERLSKFPFSLCFRDGNLAKVDKRNGKVVYTDIAHISGMEINMGALALMEVIDSLNEEWSINLRFIDELSGQLSSGKNLKNSNALDFQSLYKELLLDISKSKRLIIVDHVLKDIGNPIIEFLMGDKGGYHNI